MDTERFLDELAGLFDDFPNSTRPRGARFDDILGAVENLSTENNLALLNCAARMLGPGESYVEVGSYMGASLIGAMRGNDDKAFVAIDGFEWATRARFEANLERFGASGATVIAGDAFEVLESGALDGRRVGVLFWDADHSRGGQLRGLRDCAPLLADGALVICDNADRPAVAAAIDDWLREEPRAQPLLELAGRTLGHPQWHDGIRVLRWR